MDLTLVAADDKTVVRAHSQFILGGSKFLQSIVPRCHCSSSEEITLII